MDRPEGFECSWEVVGGGGGGVGLVVGVDMSVATGGGGLDGVCSVDEVDDDKEGTCNNADLSTWVLTNA